MPSLPPSSKNISKPRLANGAFVLAALFSVLAVLIMCFASELKAGLVYAAF